MAGKKPLKVDRAAFDKIPRKGDRKAGVTAAAVTALLAPVAVIDHAVLHGTDGTTLTVSAAELAAATLKLNQRGLWKFKAPAAGPDDENKDFGPLAKIELVAVKKSGKKKR